jgi:hypothetical protein
MRVHLLLSLPARESQCLESEHELNLYLLRSAQRAGLGRRRCRRRRRATSSDVQPDRAAAGATGEREVADSLSRDLRLVLAEDGYTENLL